MATRTLLPVSSVLRSALFYERLLGLAPLERDRDRARFRLPDGRRVELRLRDQALSVGPPRDPTSSGDLEFRLPDLSALEAFRDASWNAGATVVQDLHPTPSGAFFVALDPDGHSLRGTTTDTAWSQAGLAA